MTKKNALNVALNALALVNTDEAVEARETIATMIETLSKTRSMSNEAKAALNEARKAKTAAARAEMVAKVMPVIRGALTNEPKTAKEIFAAVESNLPEGFTALKVQNVLLREMRDTITVTEAKGKANTYSL